MKILQINTTSNWGSHGRIAEEIGILVKKNGGENYIIYGRYSNPSQSYSYKFNTKIDLYKHVILTRLFDRHGLTSNKVTYNIINKIKEIKPDIIHLHNIHGYYLNYSILFNFLSKANIPIVWTLHDCWTYTGHCAYYTFAKCNRWETGCYHCSQKNTYPSSWIIDRSKQNYLDKKEAFTSVNNMTIVPVSNWLANEVNKSFLNKYPIQVIHNGIDIKTFSPQNISKKELGINNDFIILGVASVWEGRKGLDDFIKLRKLLSSDYIIVLIGLTQKQIDKLPNGIIGLKRTNNVHELVQFYSAADVYINFSVEETFGMTTCESLACGTPVIVYNSTACPEIISNDTGYIIEIGDFDNVINKIEIIKKVGKNKFKDVCRQRVIQYFNKEDKYYEYLNLYRTLLNKKIE